MGNQSEVKLEHLRKIMSHWTKTSRPWAPWRREPWLPSLIPKTWPDVQIESGPWAVDSSHDAWDDVAQRCLPWGLLGHIWGLRDMGAGRQQNGGWAEQVLESATLSTERERLDSIPQKPVLPENQPPGRGRNKEVGGRGERLTDPPTLTISHFTGPKSGTYFHGPHQNWNDARGKRASCPPESSPPFLLRQVSLKSQKDNPQMDQKKYF